MALKSKIEVPMYWFMYMLQANVSFDKRLLVTFRYMHKTIYELKWEYKYMIIYHIKCNTDDGFIFSVNFTMCDLYQSLD